MGLEGNKIVIGSLSDEVVSLIKEHPEMENDIIKDCLMDYANKILTAADKRQLFDGSLLGVLMRLGQAEEELLKILGYQERK